MRKLFFVPIIHSPADMGTIGTLLSETSAAALGEELWDEHQKTVSRFWDSVSRFFDSLQLCNFKIYQDGLVAAGEDGLKIINEGVRQGSVNYEIISGLLQREAILIKTEDIALVQREYNYIKNLTVAKSTRERETATSRYKLAQRKLLEDRDNFIARTIESTLKEGDTGVLFIGAYHEILSKLPVDIRIVQVKEVNKVREYHRVLTNISVKTRVQYQQLAEYLVSPVLETGAD
ncbi:MAG: hypothetical protein Q7J73_03870 [Dehalococcoidales bacterium]|nr:hypothetical protein [Dehalococcoidales bacterium]